MPANLSTIRDKFSDFTGSHTADRRWVSVRGKCPVRPGTDTPIEWRDPLNRYFWEQVIMFPGDIGIILNKTGLTCVDFDKCLDENGHFLPEKTNVQDIIERLDTWVEISSSGRGLHAWVITDANIKSQKPGNGLELITDGHVKIVGNSFPQCSEKEIGSVDGKELFKILNLSVGYTKNNGEKTQFVLPEKIVAGNRNTTLLRCAGSMRKMGATDVEVVAALQVLNARCSPPLDPDELMSVASRYPSSTSAEKKTHTSTDSASLLDDPMPALIQAAKDMGVFFDELTALLKTAKKFRVSQEELAGLLKASKKCGMSCEEMQKFKGWSK